MIFTWQVSIKAVLDIYISIDVVIEAIEIADS
jgi:hypothetical protein